MIKTQVFLLVSSLFYMVISASQAVAENHSGHATHNHTGHINGPIGVMGDHPHQPGEWMFTYSYNSMDMEDHRDGSSSVSTSQVLSKFMVAPLDMNTKMHMLGMMYGIDDRLTLMVMLPVVTKSMNLITRMGMRFNTESEGIGDMSVSGIYTWREKGNSKLLLNAGIGLPTGAIDRRDDTPAGANMILPYPMQPGSGTYNLLPGITYTNHQDDWSWGSQLKAIIRVGKNDRDYRLGNEAAITVWGARKLNQDTSISLRLDQKKWGDITGADAALNPMMVPTSRTDLRGGERIDLLAGMEMAISETGLPGNRVAIEFGVPIYQRLDGPQLEVDSRLSIGIQLVF